MAFKRTKKVDPLDWGFVPVDPDPGFDPEHNRRVIQWTIEETDRQQRKRDRDYKDTLRERINAVALYVKRMEQGGVPSDLKRFFGKSELNRLRGEGNAERLSNNVTVIRDGQVLKRPDRG